MLSRKRFGLFGALLLAILTFVIPTQTAFADYYVIINARGVGTEIKSLPYTITEPGFYYIKKDLQCPADTHGITISTSDVTLDLMGFSLIGQESTGYYHGLWSEILLSNVEVRNGTIRNFSGSGIRWWGTAIRYLNLRIHNNGQCGILEWGSHALVKGCTVFENGQVGIGIDSGHSIITENIVNANSTNGIFSGPQSTVTKNICNGNGTSGTGSGIKTETGCTVIGNTANENNTYGIDLFNHSLVDQNTAIDNVSGGMSACSPCTFGSNHAP